MGPRKQALALCPLASGSKGNAYWIEDGETTILVDLGLSLRQLTRRVAEIGRDIDQVDHVFITHEHKDHVHALVQILKHHRPVIWASRGTLHALRGQIPDGAKVRMLNGRVEQAGTFQATSLPVSHDANEPVAFRFETESGSVAVVTDLGVWDNKTVKALAGPTLLVCEANHDPHMLQAGPYPFVLKRRIASSLGHLSNQEGADLAVRAVGQGTRRIVLGHMSETNNSPSLALDVFHKTLEENGSRVIIDLAAQDHPGPWIVPEPVS